MEKRVNSLAIRAHKCKELGHYRLLVLAWFKHEFLFNLDVLWEHKLQVLFHVAARLVQTKKQFGRDVVLLPD
jgi:hypothetical protein